MKLLSLTAKNFRTLEDFSCDFKGQYIAVSGKNNHGKSNLVRIIKSFFFDLETDPMLDDNPLAFSQDVTNWRQPLEKTAVEIRLCVEIHKEFDAGLYRWLEEFVSPPSDDRKTSRILCLRQVLVKGSEKVEDADIDGQGVNDKFKTTELFKKFRSSKGLIFHNSTDTSSPYLFGRRFRRMYEGIQPENSDEIEKATNKLRSLMEKSVETHQKDIVSLLGRLEDKYTVKLSPPPMNFEDFPVMIFLGDKNSHVPLDDWGSGTRNRTLIILSILRARRSRSVTNESDRVTPIILLEEAESFLHPSAQAEFGSFLQNMANELSVQVITTTHSPYLLSIKAPESNLLLNRRVDGRKLVGTELVCTEGERWMEPFGQILGVQNSVFAPWKSVLFQEGDQLLLVEGDSDRDYLEDLRKDIHGDKKFKYVGDIAAYGGTGFFDHPTLLQFILKRYRKVVFMIDLDAKGCVKRLEDLGLKRNSDIFLVGKDEDGKRDVEGLLPDRVRKKVYSENMDLVTAAISREVSAKEAVKGARNSLKKKLLEEWLICSPTPEELSEFYSLVSKLDKAFLVGGGATI